jgi:hypothetical protein
MEQATQQQPEINIELVETGSSHTQQAGYDPVTETLYTKFSNGHLGKYAGVPQEVCDSWKITFNNPAISTGKFFNTNIRNVYEYTLISGRPDPVIRVDAELTLSQRATRAFFDEEVRQLEAQRTVYEKATVQATERFRSLFGEEPEVISGFPEDLTLTADGLAFEWRYDSLAFGGQMLHLETECAECHEAFFKSINSLVEVGQVLRGQALCGAFECAAPKKAGDDQKAKSPTPAEEIANGILRLFNETQGF